MTKFLEYKGYFGSVEVDLDEGFVYGRLMFIKDVVSYRADGVRGLKPAFEAAVDDYLTMCAELGDAPDVPCKGTFNVRLGPTLHQRVAIAATKSEVSLNEWVKQACDLKLASQDPPTLSARREKSGTLLEASVEDEQYFDFGGDEDWQTQNNRRVH